MGSALKSKSRGSFNLNGSNRYPVRIFHHFPSTILTRAVAVHEEKNQTTKGSGPMIGMQSVLSMHTAEMSREPISRLSPLIGESRRITRFQFHFKLVDLFFKSPCPFFGRLKAVIMVLDVSMEFFLLCFLLL